MASIAEDKTIISLRKALDRHIGHTTERGQEHFPESLVREIADCLPAGIVKCVALPAVGQAASIWPSASIPRFIAIWQRPQRTLDAKIIRQLNASTALPELR
jgi:hypothetical protein